MVAQYVDDSEDLGRCCFDSRDSGRPRPRSRFIRRSFVNGLMSVDRLQDVDVYVLRCVHDAEALARTPPRTFHGWYVFTAATVRSAGWEVYPDPTNRNPWHSQVHLPDSMEEEDDFLQSCNKIASQSHWLVRPMSQADEEFLADVSDHLG